MSEKTIDSRDFARLTLHAGAPLEPRSDAGYRDRAVVTSEVRFPGYGPIVFKPGDWEQCSHEIFNVREFSFAQAVADVDASHAAIWNRDGTLAVSFPIKTPSSKPLRLGPGETLVFAPGSIRIDLRSGWHGA